MSKETVSLGPRTLPAPNLSSTKGGAAGDPGSGELFWERARFGTASRMVLKCYRTHCSGQQLRGSLTPGLPRSSGVGKPHWAPMCTSQSMHSETSGSFAWPGPGSMPACGSETSSGEEVCIGRSVPRGAVGASPVPLPRPSGPVEPHCRPRAGMWERPAAYRTQALAWSGSPLIPLSSSLSSLSLALGCQALSLWL